MKNININALASKMALKGVSRKNLAEMAGISYHTVSNLFSREFDPSYSVIVSVSKALELDAEEVPIIFFASYLRETQECKQLAKV